MVLFRPGTKVSVKLVRGAPGSDRLEGLERLAAGPAVEQGAAEGGTERAVHRDVRSRAERAAHLGRLGRWRDPRPAKARFARLGQALGRPRNGERERDLDPTTED